MEMVLLAPGRCDAVESATQKENGGVLGLSPKMKSNMTATLYKPMIKKPAPRMGKRIGWSGNNGGVMVVKPSQ